MSDATTLSVEMIGHVAVVTMNVPPVNALTRGLVDDLTATFDRFTDHADIRAVVLTGAGRVFCAGADLKGRTASLNDLGSLPAHSRRTRELFHAIRECAKPVVAAINGPALGAGLAIAASCDILYAAEGASLGLPEIDVGLLGGARHAMRLFGHSRLRRMVLTGDRIGAPELLRLGVIEASLPADELLPAAIGSAAAIAAKSPLGSRMAKHTLNAIEEMSLRDGYRYEQDQTAALSASAEAQEARRAFLEKRPPVFVGR